MYDIGCNSVSGEDDHDGSDTVQGRRRHRRQRQLLQGLSTMRRRVLSMTPAGQAALAVHDNKSKIKRVTKADPKAARVLAKARKGDKKEQARIKMIQKRAAKGDPKAKVALARLRAANRRSKFTEGMLTLSRWYRRGVM